MSERNFKELLESRWERGNFLCVGLDSDFEKIPEAVRQVSVRETIVAFNRAIIDATHDLVCAFKPNSAFYEAYGEEGWRALRETVQYIHKVAPDVAVILDAKRADIGNTNNGYACSAFDHLFVDAITVHPYFGAEALAPFLARKEKGIIVLVRSSNVGSGEFQSLQVNGEPLATSAKGFGEPLYKVIARHVADSWNGNGNCAVMVGATYPEELAEVRKVVGDMPILIPGIGAQGGDLEKTVAAGKDARGRGVIISVSRAVIFAGSGKDFAETARREAQRLDSEIRKSL